MAAAATGIAGITALGMGVSQASPSWHHDDHWSGGGSSTATPIKHLVVIFQENVSFDHYFGTYPQAANPPGEPAFHAAPGTPTVNGLDAALLTATRTCPTRSGSPARRRRPATRTTATRRSSRRSTTD